jgi:hypothetical protein
MRLEQRQQIVGAGIPSQISDVKGLGHAEDFSSLLQ